MPKPWLNFHRITLNEKKHNFKMLHFHVYKNIEMRKLSKWRSEDEEETMWL